MHANIRRLTKTMTPIALQCCAVALWCSSTTSSRPKGTFKQAAESGDVALVATRWQWMDDHDRRRNGWHGLQLAAAQGHVEVVDVLLDRGVAIDHGSKPITTSLHFAAGKGRVNVVKTLITRGAQVHAIDHFNKTPLHWAADNGTWRLQCY